MQPIGEDLALQDMVNTADTSPVTPDAFDLRSTPLSSRAEAEMLITMDHALAEPAPDWTAFFVESMTEFLVWGRRPTGRITESDLDWLIGVCADAPSPSTPALLFALVREAEEVPERLIGLALKHHKGRLVGSGA